jgi:hypothetical protein
MIQRSCHAAFRLPEEKLKGTNSRSSNPMLNAVLVILSEIRKTECIFLDVHWIERLKDAIRMGDECLPRQE